MATYTIVDKDKDPLGSNEINAGNKIAVSDGDTFIVDGSANANVYFVSSSGKPADFGIEFPDTIVDGFDMYVGDSLTPSVTIDDNVDLSDVDLDAKAADAVDFDAGDNVSFGQFQGSEDGANTVVIGDGFSTDQEWKLGKSDDNLFVGSNAEFRKVDTGEGDDSITFGDRALVQELDTKDGDDSVTFGDDAMAKSINTGEDDDIVRIGKNARISEVDGGNDYDELYTETAGLNEKNFEFSKVVCFVEGTLIDTRSGPAPIEELAAGHLVRTADNGYQPLRWIGSVEVSAQILRSEARLRPIRISRGALGCGLPVRDLLVSPQHRILVRSEIVRRMFGCAEILVAAKHLTLMKGIDVVAPDGPIAYFHILFDRHEVIFSHGAAAESLSLRTQAIASLGRKALQEIRSVVPGRDLDAVSVALARPSPKTGRKLRHLLERHTHNDKDIQESTKRRAPVLAVG